MDTAIRGSAPDASEISRYVSSGMLMRQHALAGTLLEAIMPNGKRLADCTGKECGEMGARMAEIGTWLDFWADDEEPEPEKPRVRVKAISRPSLTERDLQAMSDQQRRERDRLRKQAYRERRRLAAIAAHG